uniref:Endothelin-converting enzyme 1 n=1 Tax=Plectus sambesii TaxID=2011161 RepID=A0A914XSZ6_9BILA
MAAEEYSLDRGYSKSSKRNLIELLVVAVLAIAVIATLILTIIVLVKVNDASSSTTVVASGPSTTSPAITTTTPATITTTPATTTTTPPTTTTTPPTTTTTTTTTAQTTTTSPATTTTTSGQQLGINIPTLPPISSNSPNYNGYNIAVNQLKNTVNFSADPCNDFWNYVCGSYPSTMSSSFGVADYNNFVIQANQIMDPKYQQPNTPLPLQQTVWFFNQCVAAQNNFSAITQGGTIVLNALKAFQSTTSLPFPMLTQSTQQVTWPNSTTLATVLGYMSGVNGVDTLISSGVDTNWVDPQGAKPYFLYIDQSSLTYPNTYYQPGTWELFRNGFINEIKYIMTTLAQLNGATLDATTLNNDATDIANLELTLALNFSTDDTTRRTFLRSYNPTNATQAQISYPFINWSVYLKQLSTKASTTVQTIVNNPGFQFSMVEMGMTLKLSQSLVDGNAYGITPRQLVNYLTYRLVASQAGYLPSTSSFENTKKTYRPTLGKPRFIRTPEPVDPEMFENKDTSLTRAQIICTELTMGYLQYANARFFVDALYPDKGINIRNTAGPIINSILKGFQSMLDQLPWMDVTTKISAYNKITNIVENIAFPDFITNDTQLITYFSNLNIQQTDDYITILNKLDDFNAYKEWDYLSRTAGTDRTDFAGPPGTVNAWYQPELNSITFPAGILQPPYFHQNFPASINYGGLGVVAGHELTHGFDDQGVQWDGVGKLSPWMSDSSKQGFQRLANCVINEYNGFCPLPGNYTPNCIKGSQTQGENIADNGGIHAAWRAYKTYTALNGPDPLLPDPLLGQLTHDQLFFMSFGRVWCYKQSNAVLFRQLLVDPHSASQYRVFGTIQNFPAFQTAFNCPANSVYAPSKHCNVWVQDNN